MSQTPENYHEKILAGLRLENHLLTERQQASTRMLNLALTERGEIANKLRDFNLSLQPDGSIVDNRPALDELDISAVMTQLSPSDSAIAAFRRILSIIAK